MSTHLFTFHVKVGGLFLVKAAAALPQVEKIDLQRAKAAAALP